MHIIMYHIPTRSLAFLLLFFRSFGKKKQNSISLNIEENMNCTFVVAILNIFFLAARNSNKSLTVIDIYISLISRNFSWIKGMAITILMRKIYFAF